MVHSVAAASTKINAVVDNILHRLWEVRFRGGFVFERSDSFSDLSLSSDSQEVFNSINTRLTLQESSLVPRPEIILRRIFPATEINV